MDAPIPINDPDKNEAKTVPVFLSAGFRPFSCSRVFMGRFRWLPGFGPFWGTAARPVIVPRSTGMAMK